MDPSRRSLLGGLLIAASPAAFARAAQERVAAPSLSYAAARRGRAFGAALRFSELDAEPALRAAVLRDCSRITPEVHLMWKALQPAPGVYDHEEMDRLLGFAQAHVLPVHGHALLWHGAIPAWAQARLERGCEWSLVANHLRTTLERYGSAIPTWTVLNEPLAPDPRQGVLRASPFARAFGPGYIVRALREAQTLAPGARLFINEYGLDYDNPVDAARRRSLLGLVRQLKQTGVPLHGVGVQAHLDLSKGPLRVEPLRAFFADLAALDVEIAITELDVKEDDFTSPLDVRDARVATEVARYLEAALDERAVTSVTSWGLTDRHSWLPGPEGRMEAGEAVAASPRDRNRGLPYDENLQPKAVYWALQRSLDRSRWPQPYSRVAYASSL